jgi:hypothetical protein
MPNVSQVRRYDKPDIRGNPKEIKDFMALATALQNIITKQPCLYFLMR